MSRSLLMKMAIFTFLLFGSTAMAAMVSTPKNVNAVFEAQGFRLVPVSEVHIAGDESPAKVYEIIHYGNTRIKLGRLFTSCSCIQLEAPKSTFEPGERAFVTLRNIRPTPASGQNYALYVQITSPIRTTLRADFFLQSDRFRQQPQPSMASSLARQPYAPTPQPQYQAPYQQPYQYQPQYQYQYQYAQPQPTATAGATPAQPYQSANRQSYRW